MNILASFGMWLTRRFGSVRPGEAPLLRKGDTLRIEIEDTGLLGIAPLKLHPDSEGKISPEEGEELFQRLAALRSMGIVERSVYEGVIRRAIEKPLHVEPTPSDEAATRGEAKPSKRGTSGFGSTGR